MITYNYSQLPVMQGEREVKGVITWKSIGEKIASGSKSNRVKDFQEEARIVEASWPLLEVIPTIADHGYVLVRQHDKRITGIVTASDLNNEFHIFSEPFLLIREIELHIRSALREKLQNDDFKPLCDLNSSPRKLQDVSELTFGDYVRLLENPTVWARLELQMDRVVLKDLIDTVRRIRNDLVHFDPDPIAPTDIDTLKRAARLMQKHSRVSPRHTP